MANGTIAFDTLSTSGQIDGTARSIDTDYLLNGSAKCWNKTAADGASIEDSFNITSLTDTGTGAQTHNINNDMANDDYAPQLTQIASTDFQAVAINNIATGSFRGNMFDASALRDEKQSVVVFGELA
tara:strand:+ start:331 stop:711 length:381 start_codon:yes stop_codon:yes gene_type:complete